MPAVFFPEFSPAGRSGILLALALFFFRNIGQLLSRDYILENVWGQRVDLKTRTIDMHVSRLRHKLRIEPENGWRLAAVYQHGYRLESMVRNDTKQAI